MSKSKSPPLRRIRLDARGWLALAGLAALWLLVLRGWPLVGHQAAIALGRWLHPAFTTEPLSLAPNAGGMFGGMAPVDIMARFTLYALETAAVGLIGWQGFALIARKTPGRLLSDAPRFRIELMLFGLIVCAGVILAARAALTLTGGAPLELGWGVGSLPAQALWAVDLLTLTLLVGFFEETIFRGGLLRLAPKSRWLLPFALIVNAALFAAVHGAQSPVDFVDRFALGLALSWATLRVRGIELAVGLHAGFDFAAMLLNPNLLERAAGLATPLVVASAAPALPLAAELVAGTVMAAIFSLIALVLSEIAVRFAGGLGFAKVAAPFSPTLAWDDGLVPPHRTASYPPHQPEPAPL